MHARHKPTIEQLVILTRSMLYDGVAAHTEPSSRLQLDGAVTLPISSPLSAAELHTDATLPTQRMIRVIPSRVCFFHFSRVRRPLHRAPVG